ncbi:hypothetical protein [Nonomuraea sp. B19D2]|uniref:hypothetical protein n=1 Tax=Nonomuraea sp. B19D2 TaxID=3159561 RepID=UPI0032DB8326
MVKPAAGGVLGRGEKLCGLSLWRGFPVRDGRLVGVLIGEFVGGSRRLGRVDGFGLVDVAPLVEEVVVGDGDEQRDQDGLGDTAVGEPVPGVDQAEVR